MILAVLFAMATVASLAGFLCSNFVSQGSARSGCVATCRTRDVMPTTMSWRRYRSPILVIFPNRSLPPLEWLRGVSPNHAANSRPLLNCRPDPIVAATAEAVTGPTPGIVCRS